MHYSNKIFLNITLFLLLSISAIDASEYLYECLFDGKQVSYHENEVKRMQLLGAECHQMQPDNYILCSVDGVKVSYTKEEADKLLATYPKATCEIDNNLYMAYGQKEYNEPLQLEKHLVVYFSVNSYHLYQEDRDKLKEFVKRYKNMGYFFTITGYASATGSSSKNHLLSLKRAGKVNNILLDYGISFKNIISVDALGEESLRYNTQYEEIRNRAVEIKVYQHKT
jgi:outer membrane protein OmpA-like peptidoglycan-associated protein